MTSPLWTGVASLAAGGCGGLLSGLFGIGGGIVLIPLLGLVLGLPQHQAQGATLAAMLLPNGLPAVLHMRSRGIRIHWRVVALLTAGFLPAVWAGAQLAVLIPATPLRLGFAAFLWFIAARTLLQKPAAVAPVVAGAPPAPEPGRRWAVALAIGATGGLASGLLGIGGGLIMIPLMVWALSISQHEAQAASLALMLAPIGLPGVIVYARSAGGVPWLVLGGVALGFASGGYAGARVATRVKGPRLRQAFAVVLAVMATIMAVRAF